ncbi:hypothetical protein DIPPA_33843 [Diplonema papillatum]|nr:hypothetical protein DIPPA_33843 [Diplonema papillatum]
MLRRIGCRTRVLLQQAPPYEEYPEDVIEELRRTKWKNLGEADRLKMEWAYGNPYYLPSADGCETQAAYEEKCNAVFLTMQDRAQATDDNSQSDFERALELQKATTQRQLFDEVMTSRNSPYSGSSWVARVEGQDGTWLQALKDRKERIDAAFDGRSMAPAAESDEPADHLEARRRAERLSDPYRPPDD